MYRPHRNGPTALLYAIAALLCCVLTSSATVPACEITNSTPYLFDVVNEFEVDNAACWADFQTCLAANSSHCTRTCSTEQSALSDACSTYAAIFCTVSGRTTSTIDGVVPFNIRTAACIPSSCGRDWHDTYQATWRHTLCGPELANTSACAAVQVSCEYDDGDGGKLWVIVGSVTGAFGGVMAVCGIAYCYMRRKEMEEEDDELGGSDEYIEAELLGYANDGPTQPSSAREEREAEWASLVVDDQEDHEDPTPYTYAQPPTNDAPR